MVNGETGRDYGRETPIYINRPTEDSRATLRDDDGDDEESIAGSSTISRRLRWGIGGPSAARRQLQRLNFRNRTANAVRGGAREVEVFSVTGSLLRALQSAMILTTVITVLIVLKYADKPRSELAAAVDFRTLPRLDVAKLQNAVLWDETAGERGKFNVLLEMHTHTTHSDGELTPEQVVDWAVAYGFNAVVVSDHQTLSGARAAKEYADRTYNQPNSTGNGILVIPALEYTTCRIHLSLIGLPFNSTFSTSSAQLPHSFPPPTAWPTNAQLKQVITATHQLGGLAIANHLPWSLATQPPYNMPTLPTHPTREQLLSWGIDGFESLHGTTLDLPTLRFSRKNGLPLISATDLHKASDIPHGWTVVSVPSSSSSSAPSQAQILAALKNGDSTFLYDPTDEGRTVLYPPENPRFDKWAIVQALDVASLFYKEDKGMYSFTGEFCHPRRFTLRQGRIGWFVGWMVVGWGVYELLRCATLWILSTWFLEKRTGRIRL